MSELLSNKKGDLLPSKVRTPMSSMSGIGHHRGSSNMPILMRVEDNIYQENLPDSQECYVLVDGRSVQVMPRSSAVRLISGQESSLVSSAEKTVQMMQIESTKALEMLDDGNQQSIKVEAMNNGRTVEVLPIEDGKTVEVVQMEGEKTLEVMHVNAVKHSEVIHVDGSSSIELLSVGDSLQGPTLTTSSTIYKKIKDKCILAMHGREFVSSLDLKRSLASASAQSTGGMSLSSLSPVSSSVVITTPKNSLLSEHQFSTIPSGTTLVTSRQSQVIESDLKGLAQVTPSIIISHHQKMTADNVDSLNDAIIISWPPMSPKLENTVGTQTEFCTFVGPSLNLFMCTFHLGGHAETLCDMPLLRDVAVSTNSSKRCEAFPYGSESNDGLAIKTEHVSPEGNDSRFSRSGRPLKLKDSFFKSISDFACKNYFNSDLEENELNRSHGNEDNSIVKKKRRKRKKRYVPSDDYDVECSAYEDTDEVKAEQVMDNLVPKEEPVDEEDEELALNILKSKGYGLRTKRRIKKMHDMHYMEEKVTKKKLEKTLKFTCQTCSDTFQTFPRLQRHAKAEHNSSEFAFPCDQCGVVFTRPHNLDRHKETRHGDGKKRFICEHCDSRFSRQDVLSVHISMVHFKKSLQGKSAAAVYGPSSLHCTGCDQYFSKEQKLQNHRNGDFTCSTCQLTFECKTSFRSHQYKHHPRTCSECGKVCNSRQQLYLHKLTHDPKYICKFCHKGFLWKSQYAIHLSTHTGEKPVVCDICGKSFAHKLAVNKHKWQEHNDENKKFKCPTCVKSFVYKAKLQSHMRSHTGEKPFICEVCPASFTQRCNLTSHVRSVHGVYIHSIKSDGTTQTQLVKYKRIKKSVPVEAQPTVVNAVMAQAVQTAVAEQPHITQVQMPESFETEAAVYQIVYAYQQ